MKRSDLGIVMLHWVLVVVLLGSAASGVCLWKKELQPRAAFLFPPPNLGVIHISLSVAVVALILLYLWYLRHKNFGGHLTIRIRAQWKYANIMLYWALVIVIALETISGILLTKLINQDVLARVFGIEKMPLLALHLYLVLPILAFPIAHVFIHWMDGKVLAIFRPRVFARRPSMTSIMIRLKEENIRLKQERGDARDECLDPNHSPRR
jgi:cytochrome b subunit of formate dehydrogenase